MLTFFAGIILGGITMYLACRNNPKVVAKLNADLAAAQGDLALIKAKAASLGYKI